MGERRGSADATTVAARRTPPVATLSLDTPAEGSATAFDAEWTEATRYALVSELAQGGGGKIAVAVDRKLGRRVAVKRPLDRDGDVRLEREALVLARLEHPAIVPIHDAGLGNDGSPFYTMKLVRGRDLAAAIAETTTFEERLALLPIVTTVADATAYAHSERVIHRDLKPANVLVGEFGEVAVIDWGLGKVLGAGEAPHGGPAGSGLTEHGSIVGTPAYMAPEQAAGNDVDERADVYALGAMLYQVLTGELPFGNLHSDETLVRLVEGPAPPAVATREPRIPRDLAAIVGKAMAHDPVARYGSARELADDLHRYQTGRLVAAHRYRPWTRAWRWARRQRTKLAVALAAGGIAAATALFVLGGQPDETCAGVDVPARDAWNPVVAATLAPRFAAANAIGRWRIVRADLDARADQIADMRVGACRAARVTGQQTLDALDLRMTCLDRRVAEVHGYTTWLADGDIAHAVDQLAGFGRVADCADLARLRDLEPMPADPAKRSQIAAVEGELRNAIAIGRDGKYREAEAALTPLVPRAEALGYGPLRARALFDRAQILLLQTKTPETLALVAQAMAGAERAGDDRLRGDLLKLRIHVEVNTLEHFDAAAELVDQMLAIGDRVHDPELVSAALGYRAQIELRLEHRDDALRDSERALAILPDPNSRSAWVAMFRLGAAYVGVHRVPDALRTFQQLIASERAVIGDADDPSLANDLLALAAAYDKSGDRKRAYEVTKQAVGILDRTLPADSKARLGAHTNLAVVQSALGDREGAIRELTALLPIAERKLGHDHGIVADIVFRIAEANEHAHHEEAALAGYRDAAARYDHSGTQLVWAAKSHGHVATVLLEMDRPREALPEYEAALATISKLRGADSPEAAIWRGDIGRVYVTIGEPRRAIPELERALAVFEKEPDRVERGMYRMNLAMAKWALGERPRALELAKLARADLESAGVEGKDNLEDLTAWEKARK